MTKGAVIGLSIGAAGLAALAIHVIDNPSGNVIKKVTGGGLGYDASDHKNMQGMITRILTSDDSGGWRKWREDNLSGDPNRIENNKWDVWKQATMYSHTTNHGEVADFFYPGLETQMASNDDDGGMPGWIEDIIPFLGTVVDTIGDVLGGGSGEPTGDEGDGIPDYDGGGV